MTILKCECSNSFHSYTNNEIPGPLRVGEKEKETSIAVSAVLIAQFPENGSDLNLVFCQGGFCRRFSFKI